MPEFNYLINFIFPKTSKKYQNFLFTFLRTFVWLDQRRNL